MMNTYVLSQLGIVLGKVVDFLVQCRELILLLQAALEGGLPVL